MLWQASSPGTVLQSKGLIVRPEWGCLREGSFMPTIRCFWAADQTTSSPCRFNYLRTCGWRGFWAGSNCTHDPVMSVIAMLRQPMADGPCQHSIDEITPQNQMDDLPQNTRYKPQSPTITGPSIIHWQASVRCRHPSSGMYPHIAATPAQANTRKIRFSFVRICNSFGISIPIQAASSPAHPPTASLTVRAVKGSVYPSGFASALGRSAKSVSDRMMPKKMKHIAGPSAIKPAIAQNRVINLSRITGQYLSVHPELCA